MSVNKEVLDIIDFIDKFIIDYRNTPLKKRITSISYRLAISKYLGTKYKLDTKINTNTENTVNEIVKNIKDSQLQKDQEIKEDLEINLIGLIKSIKSVLKNLNNSVSASIVLFSTVAAQRGMPFHSSISAAKAGVEGLAKSLAAEFSPKIRVNVIAPSLVNTPLANRFLNNDIKIEKSSQRHPLKRIGQPEDISNFIEYLLSEKSSWMTGQIISIDGGLSTIETN